MDNNKSVETVKSFDEFQDLDPKNGQTRTEAESGPADLKTQLLKTQIPALVEAGSDGVLIPRTIEGLYRYATYLCKSKLVPTSFDTPEKVFAVLQYAYELGLKPMTALRQTMVIKGVPAIWGDLPLSLVRKSGKLKRIREYWFDKDLKELGPIAPAESVFGAYCEVQRVGDEDIVARSYTMLDAKVAGLLDKNDSIWKKQWKRMLQCRARAWALKDDFQDVLSGVAIAEYDYNTIPDNDAIINVTPDEDKAALLKKRLSEEGSLDAPRATPEEVV